MARRCLLSFVEHCLSGRSYYNRLTLHRLLPHDEQVCSSALALTAKGRTVGEILKGVELGYISQLIENDPGLLTIGVSPAVHPKLGVIEIEVTNEEAEVVGIIFWFS